MVMRFFVVAMAVGCMAVSITRVGAVEPYPYDPVAPSASVVKAGNARFTVLTSRVIRIEYARNEDGTFEDRATLAILNRKTETPNFHVTKQGRSVIIDTDYLRLNYTQPGADDAFRGFSPENLVITNSVPGKERVYRNVPQFTWRFGDVDSGNLFGTVRTLDDLQDVSLNCSTLAGFKIHNESMHCEYGLISRMGWSVYNDSSSPVLDDDDWPVNELSKDSVDLYFFGHGWDFRQALKDYTLIGGKVPMLPRYGLGIMWSRWYDMDTWSTMKIIEDYSTRSIPLDVYITDMDWHLSGWTGYTFNKKTIPFPNETFGWIHDQGLKVAANLHDASGVQSFEECYEDMAKANGINPQSGQTVAANFTDKAYMTSLDDLCWRRLPFDIPWIDWQQGGETGVYIHNVNPTMWLNHARATNNIRWGENKRSMNLARYGGMGNHRYQAGFSGDVIHTWAALAFQPYFTSTASNVLFGYWSHDIMGSAKNYELFTRWVQWGSVSPLFRTHDMGMAEGGCALLGICSVVEIWNQPKEYFEIARNALADRQRLIPYMYTLNRETYDDGIGPLRPMYYDWPDRTQAYSSPVITKQYMMGSDLLISPVTAPVNESNLLANWSVWLPPGLWYERTTGTLLNSSNFVDGNYTHLYDLTEIPIFIKGGSIIPQIPYNPADVLGVAKRTYTSLHFDIAPGSTQGSQVVYEDDGESLDYTRGTFAWTSIKYQRSSNQMWVNISTKGSVPKLRDYSVGLLNCPPPETVKANGQVIPFSRFSGPNTWTFSGRWIAPIILVSDMATSSPLIIEVSFSSASQNIDLQGVRGRIMHSSLSKSRIDPAITSSIMKKSCPSLQQAASTGAALEHFAGTNLTEFSNAVLELKTLVPTAAKEIKDLVLNSNVRQNAMDLLEYL